MILACIAADAGREVFLGSDTTEVAFSDGLAVNAIALCLLGLWRRVARYVRGSSTPRSALAPCYGRAPHRNTTPCYG